MTSLSNARPVGAAPSHPLLGVACGAGAGALWGLVFLAPALVKDFDPLQLSIGRYLCYGLLAALMLAPRWRQVATSLSRSHWFTLSWLALTGNIVYYILLSSAVQLGGIAMTSLVIGFLPVAVTVIGSRDTGAAPFKALVPSLLLSGAGALCIGWEALAASNAAAPGSSGLGLVCAVGALASWTAFAVGNARALKRMHVVSGHDWSLLTGIVTGAQSLLLLPLALLLATTQHDAHQWVRFASVSLALALVASIAGNALWNRMSRLLPLTVVGQMILFETVFALVYGLAWERRLPSVYETLALIFVVSSVLACLAAHRSLPDKRELA